MKTTSLRDVHQAFTDYLRGKKHSASTVVAYGKDVAQRISFLEEFSRENIGEVTNDDIQAFLIKLSGEGYTPKSISRKLNSTRTFYRFLKINGYITDNPSLLVSHPKYELAPPRILRPTEYRALRDAARHDPRMFAIIELLLQTGIRIGELAALQLIDIRQDGLYIRPIEKHAERIVPLNRSAKEALNRYISVRPEVKEDRIFVTKSGKTFLIRNIRTAVERYFRLAEIKGAKVNDLRHTFVAHHLKHGVTTILLSKVLGHKRLSTTERYLEYSPERGKETNSLSEL